ncbi:MAG: TolC family protein [Acidobacteria bacterium]|nr:TolC family protein [Acidobacteriota bacterium]
MKTRPNKISSPPFLAKAVAIAWLALHLVNAGALPAWAQTTTPRPLAKAADLTLPLAVDVALRANPLMRATSAGREIADAQVNEARAARLPLLQLGETVSRSNNPVFVFGSLLEQGKFGASNFALAALNNPPALTNLRTTITLKLPLFDQRQSATRIAQAQLRQQQADTQTEQMQQQIRFEVLRTFYGVLLAKTRKEVADEAVKMAAADVKRSGDLVDTGMAVTSDLLSAEVQLADFRQQQIQAEGDIVIAVAALNTALGASVNAPQTISGQLLEKAFVVEAPEVLLRLALEHRPDYMRAGLSVRVAEKQTTGTRSERLPRVDVFTSAGVSSSNFTTGSSDYLLGASVTFNLFDAGRKERLRQSQAAETIASAELESLANQIRFEVVRAYQQYLSARQRLTVAAQVIHQADEALRIVQARYHAGLTTMNEVLQAETMRFRARMNVLAARYDHYIGYANVLLASGRLTDVQAFVA